MQELTFIAEEDLEGGYTARALGEAIFTEGDTVEELKANIREAVLAHFDDGEAPRFRIA
jgi:predicted RNase H-like HicB family nuclease